MAENKECGCGCGCGEKKQEAKQPPNGREDLGLKQKK